MPSNLILSKKEIRKASILSKNDSAQEFKNWLKKRKSGVSGIEQFLRDRSNNIDSLISSLSSPAAFRIKFYSLDSF